MSPRTREWRIGEHRFHHEPPDLLRADFQGRLYEQEAIQLMHLYEEVSRVEPFFLLVDVGAAEGIDPDAQRYLNDHMSPTWMRGIIYFHARLVHRAVSAGLLLASEMARAEVSPLRGKVHFAATEQEARAIIARMRAGEDVLPP
ncbi:hypothetical protein [Melittangium boletus]|uniref:hypothetical protein n=1 Tax=Melittangium boletus TaxID=83453 RepID=UPI003DA66AC4